MGVWPNGSFLICLLSRSKTVESHRIIELSSSMFHLHCRHSAHLSASVNEAEHGVLPSNWIHKCVCGLFLKSFTAAVWIILTIVNS